MTDEDLADALDDFAAGDVLPRHAALIRQAAARLRELSRDGERLAKDVRFLLKRASRSGSMSFGADRDYGVSSNSLVAMAYEASGARLELPLDQSDLAACELAYRRLPAHRKTGRVEALLNRQRAAIDQAKAGKWRAPR